ncbi:MAG: SEL1-like repeat protein [Alphaproteobacteria bacterium]|nr:SEL1-like repeat protein [Alphaproteobacteria bacterium SS10]
MSDTLDDEVLVLEDGSETGHGKQDGRGQPPRHKPRDLAESDAAEDAFIQLMTALGGQTAPDDEGDTDQPVDETGEDAETGDLEGPDWEAVADPLNALDDAEDWDKELAALIDGLETEVRNPDGGATAQPLQEQISDALIRNRFAEGGEQAARQFPMLSPPDEVGRIGAMLGADQAPLRRTELGHLPLVETSPTDKLDDVAAVHGAIVDATPEVELQTMPVAQPVPAILLAEADPALAEDAFDDAEDKVVEAEIEETDATTLEEPVAEETPPVEEEALLDTPDTETPETLEPEAKQPAPEEDPDELEHPDIALAEDPLYQASAPIAGDSGWVNRSGLRLAVDETSPAKKSKPRKAEAAPKPAKADKKAAKQEAAQARQLAKAEAKQAKLDAKRAKIDARATAQAAKKAEPQTGTNPGVVVLAASLVMAMMGGVTLFLFHDQPLVREWTAPLRERAIELRANARQTPTSTIPSLADAPAPAVDAPTQLSQGATLPLQPVEDGVEPTLTIAELEALGGLQAPAPAELADEVTETAAAAGDVAAAPEPAPTPEVAEPTPVEVQEVAALPSPAVVPPQTETTDITEVRLAAPPALPLPAELEALRNSAAAGNRQAQHDLGAHFAAGRLVEQDFARAAYWFQEAAIRSVDNAQYNLGVLFQQGLGVEQNAALAVQWYERAADNGHVEAKYNMGVAYADGIGVERDIAQAVRWFEEAAAEGISRAAFNLGVMYEVGMIGSPDLAVARQWYRQAATSGEQDAINALERLDAAN